MRAGANEHRLLPEPKIGKNDAISNIAQGIAPKYQASVADGFYRASMQSHRLIGIVLAELSFWLLPFRKYCLFRCAEQGANLDSSSIAGGAGHC